MLTSLADKTTMRLGGPAADFAVAATSADLVQLVSDADAAGTDVLIIGGGSNLLIGDAGFDGLVVQVMSSGMAIDGDVLTVDAGVEWDAVVRYALANGLAGLEALSGIPGTAGGTPVQNVGAYGTVTSDVLSGLTVYDRETKEVQAWAPEQCEFGPHRQSLFKHTARYVVLDISYRLAHSDESRPIRYAGLADELSVDIGATAPAAEVRRAVLDLRGGKGMVLQPEDHDTWSVGSFFLNPVLTEVPAKAADCPQHADPSGVKLSAAWLIDHAGFPRGYALPGGRVSLSTKHALAITNRGGATTAEVLAFARHIRDGVEARFDVRLSPECDLVNCSLD